MLRTCNARVSSFEYGSFAMQYAVACAISSLDLHSDRIFFFKYSGLLLLRRSRLQAIHKGRLNLKIRKSRLIVCYCNCLIRV